MTNHSISKDTSWESIRLHFHDDIHYKTLMESLSDLKTCLSPNTKSLAVDFSQAQSILFSYSQFLHFKRYLHVVLDGYPAIKAHIIGPAESRWQQIFACTHPTDCLIDTGKKAF